MPSRLYVYSIVCLTFLAYRILADLRKKCSEDLAQGWVPVLLPTWFPPSSGPPASHRVGPIPEITPQYPQKVAWHVKKMFASGPSILAILRNWRLLISSVTRSRHQQLCPSACATLPRYFRVLEPSFCPERAASSTSFIVKSTQSSALSTLLASIGTGAFIGQDFGRASIVVVACF